MGSSGANLSGTYAGVSWHEEVTAAVEPIATSGTWGAAGVIRDSASFYCLQRFQTASDADGNYIAWDVYLAAGTWRLDGYFRKEADAAIVQASVDGVDTASTWDLYNASNLAARFSQTGIVVATSGLKRIKFTVNGKNATSTGRFVPISGFALTRTA